ncbi:hypothetical protein M433DRAFT_160795 [Acidomyces richmondensis BFW]|nr:hypothetical protein M433DRAFT_160795 [Acidomyces richmondensis BFW]
MATLTRTEHIGLGAYLTKRRVSEARPECTSVLAQFSLAKDEAKDEEQESEGRGTDGRELVRG